MTVRARFACVSGFFMFAALAAPRAAGAQRSIEFLPRADFHLDAGHVRSDQLRFKWDANLFGDVDLIGWKGGRATFLANYEVVLGDQFRRFDPNQGNYALEGYVTQRVAGVEVSAVFHHISRHLADRPKVAAVDWNMAGVRLRKQWTSGALLLDGRIDARPFVLEKQLVDYEREVEGALLVRYDLKPRVSVFTNATVRVVGVDGSRHRGTQTGVRTEGGLHLKGTGGSVELFVAGERRIDPYPIEFGTERWVMAGFRLLSR